MGSGLFGGGGQTQPAYYTAPGGAQNAGSYIPTAQPQMDQSLQGLIGQFGSQANALYGNNAMWPSSIYGSAASAVAGQQPAIAGAQNNASDILNQLYGMQGYYLPGVQEMGTTAQRDLVGTGQAQSALGTNALNSLAGFLHYYLPGVQGQGQAAQQAQLALGQSLAPVSQNLMGASGQLLNQAFDPQQALYNQLANQTQQQAAASSAMSGLSGSPYAANLANQARTNLDIGWNAQQQANEAAGLSAAAGGYGAGANLGAMGAGLINQSGLTPALDTAQLYSSMLAPAGVAGNLGAGAAGMLNQAGLLPASDSTSFLNSILGSQNSALQQLYGGTNQNLGALGQLNALGSSAQQQYENALQSYLGLGQSASGLAGQLGQMGFNQNQVGLGNILGAAGLGSNLLFGSQGIGGALGLGGGGLLGALPSTAISTGADFAGGVGTGLLGMLGGLFL